METTRIGGSPGPTASGRSLPEPDACAGVHGYVGKRVRTDVAEGAALLLFSAGISVGLALVFALLMALVVG